VITPTKETHDSPLIVDDDRSLRKLYEAELRRIAVETMLPVKRWSRVDLPGSGARHSTWRDERPDVLRRVLGNHPGFAWS
jgi:hypothetical protein